jgi:predicted DNA binding protein
MPCVWVGGEDADAFPEMVDESPYVESASEIGRLDGRSLYRIYWGDAIETMLDVFAEYDATVLEAWGAGQWRFRARFPSHDDLSGFHRRCRSLDVDLSIARIHPFEADQRDRTWANLTEQQYDALVMAVDRGYFDIPRSVTLTELAGDLDISAQAASERLRRGVNTVLRSELAVDSSNRS